MTLTFEMCSPRGQMAQAVAAAGAVQARIPNIRLDDSSCSTILFVGSRFSVNISFMKIPNTHTSLYVSMVYAFTRRTYFRYSRPLCYGDTFWEETCKIRGDHDYVIFCAAQ